MLGVSLLEEHFSAPVDFLLRYILLMSGKEPNVPERVFQRTRAITVKLVNHWLDCFCPCINGLSKLSVHILHVYIQRNR
jgi:hypothetical protein